jgi:glucuronokinase
VRWATTIPRGVGLGGSSAIVIAVLRALAELQGAKLPEAELAEMALAVETEDLGIAAGLQDRVAQAYGGLMFMDFADGGRRYERLDPALLPPLVVAWRSDAAEDSRTVHDDLRARFTDGEPMVRQAMASVARCAWGARAALLSGDRDEFARCVDATFDARAGMIALAPRHVEMIEVARACGASANYTGSGGAIVAVCKDERHRESVALALSRAGCGTARVNLQMP